jgi:hypothetical protein
MSSHRVIGAFAVALALALPSAGLAGRQSLVTGPRSLRGLTFESVAFQVPGDWMRNPRLRGRLEVGSGGRKDVDVFVLRQDDLPAWEKGREVIPLHAARRATTIALDVPLPGPGRYVVVLSNRFSKLASKQVSGEVLLTWEDDPSLPAGEALRAQVRFLDLPPAPGRLVVPVNAADSLAVVIIEPAPAGPTGLLALQVRRRATPQPEIVGHWSGQIEEVGTVDLHADGDRDVLVVGSASDSSGARRDLVLVCPRQLASLTLSLVSSSASATSPPVVRYGDTYAQARFAAEQSFLERLVGAYGGAGARNAPERKAPATPGR